MKLDINVLINIIVYKSTLKSMSIHCSQEYHEICVCTEYHGKHAGFRSGTPMYSLCFNENNRFLFIGFYVEK